MIGLHADVETEIQNNTGEEITIDNCNRSRKKIEFAYDQLKAFKFKDSLIRESLRHTNDLQSSLQYLCLHYDGKLLPKRFSGVVDYADCSDTELVMVVNATPSKKVETATPSKKVEIATPSKKVETATPSKKVENASSIDVEDMEETPKEIEMDMPKVQGEIKAESVSWTKMYLERERELQCQSKVEKCFKEIQSLNGYQEELSVAKKEKNKKEKNRIGQLVKETRERISKIKVKLSKDELQTLADMETKWEEVVDENKVEERKVEESKVEESIVDRDEGGVKEMVNDEMELEENDGGEMGMFGMFEPEESEIEVQTEVVVETCSDWIRNKDLDTDWTGSNPVVALQEYCRKLKYRPPAYKSAKSQYRKGYRIAVTINDKQKMIRIELPESYETAIHAKEAVANRLLYELQKDVPMYRVFARHHSDAWKGWIQEEIDEKNKHKAVKDKAYKKVIDEIYNDGLPHTKVYQEYTEPKVEYVPNDWDEELEDNLNTFTKVQRKSPPPAPVNAQADLKIQKILESCQASRLHQELLKTRMHLPATSFKKDILSLLQHNNVILISGSTGCGKTTQIPQFILQEAIKNGDGERCNIVCTQPRRIAAIGVAERVANELGQQIHDPDSLVGYQIRMKTVISKVCRLRFCTTGVLLRQLMHDTELSNISHIIVDEVHERDVQTDFLLALLKNRLLDEKAPNLKIVLMSATADASRFSSYYNNCPVLSIPGKLFPIQEYFIEDVLEMTGYTVERQFMSGSTLIIDSSTLSALTSSLRMSFGKDLTKHGKQLLSTGALEKPDIKVKNEIQDDGSGYSLATQASMKNADPKNIQFGAMEALLVYLVENDNFDVYGSILIFLPGMSEIQELSNMLSRHKTFSDSDRFWVLQLHSMLSSADQRLVFQSPPKGVRKIIVSTNIAETSITIDDVTCVIDAGKVKQIRYDPKQELSSLKEVWTSRASSKQRMGRAGRVMEGTCYRIYPRHIYTDKMSEFDVPEILRVSLIELCLQIKVFGYESCQQFFNQFLDIPPSLSIEKAIYALENIGAFENKNDLEEGKLTTLGKHLAFLPVDIKIAKTLLYGHIFNCMDPILTVGALLNGRSIYDEPREKQRVAKTARKPFQVPNSDVLSDTKIFQEWNALVEKDKKQARAFVTKYFLHEPTLYDIRKERRQFSDLLKAMGFFKSKCKTTANENANNWKLLSAIICSGLYPHFIQYSSEKKRFYEKNMEISIHPTSMNNNLAITDLKSKWAVYLQKLHTSRVYARNTTFVSPESIMLFCGDLQVDPENQQANIDEWITIDCPGRVGFLLLSLRRAMQHLIHHRLENPSSIVSDNESTIIRIIAKIHANTIVVDK